MSPPPDVKSAAMNPRELPPLDLAVQELKAILEEKKKAEHQIEVLSLDTWRYNVTLELGDAHHTFFGIGPNGWNPKLEEIRELFKAAMAIEVENLKGEAAKRIAVITEASLGIASVTTSTPVAGAERKLEAQS